MAFRGLSDIKNVLRLIESLLGGCVLSLRHDQAIEILADGHRQSPPGYFGLGFGQSLRFLRLLKPRCHEYARRKILMENSPGAIHVDTVVRDESSVGDKSAVTLRPKILHRTIDGG